MNVSVCIITKNEVEHLEKCLKALQPYDFEIVIVDTGSADNTKKLAANYTDAIYDFVWCDDFAAAKNYAVQKAKNDMVFVVDSDEYIMQLDTKKLCEMVAAHPREVGRIQRINAFVRNGEMNRIHEWVNRIFDRRLFHYEGRIHEQIVPGSVFEMECVSGNQKLKHETYKTYCTNVEMEHSGYDGSPEAVKKKAERNIRLLKREYEETPDDTYIMYQLGKSYYMAGNYPEAVRYFELALGYDLEPKLEYVIDMVESYGYALLNCGCVETALLMENIYQEFGKTADFQFLMGLIYMNNGLFTEAVAEFMKASKQKTAKAEGVNSYLSYYNAGVIKECLGATKEAKELYEKCGDYEKAKLRLKELRM